MLKISIVTPSYNQGKFIEECLRSVGEQDYPAVEHIVVDGGSTDGTVEILKRYSSQPRWEHLRWISEPDSGQSDALNKGFRMAKGDVIGWLNSDDRYRPGCLDTVAVAFAEYHAADIIYGDYTFMDEAGKISQIRREIEFSRFILAYHRVLYIATTASFFRRRIFDEGNWIDDKFHLAMDYDFYFRLAQRDYCFQHVPEVLADFRRHVESKSCSETHEQFEERDAIVQTHSTILKKVPAGLPRKMMLFLLRATAGGLRYSEKLRRGYYWSQWRVGVHLKTTVKDEKVTGC